MLLTRPLYARHERRRRGLHTRREGPDDLVERVRSAQNRGAVPAARRNHNAPARTVARGVDAVAGGPSEIDAFARRLMVSDAVVVEQAHGAPQWFRVRIGRPQVPIRGQPPQRPGPRALRSAAPGEQRVAGRLVRADGVVAEPAPLAAPHLDVALRPVLEEGSGAAAAAHEDNMPRLRRPTGPQRAAMR